MKKKWILAPAAITGAVVAAFGFAGNYFYNTALNTTKKRNFPNNSSTDEKDKQEEDEQKKILRLTNEEFEKRTGKVAVDIKSGDGLKLKAYKYLNTANGANHKWVIVVHGYTSKASEMMTFIRNFYEHGYNVLGTDLRGHGESEGRYIGMGWDDRLDLLLWINALVQDDPEAEIALFGLSMGAATVMMVSGEDLPGNVKVIIEDCGYTSISDEFAHQLKKMYGLPAFPFLHAAGAVTRIRAGYDIYGGSAVKQIAKSKTPMLFIHGGKDSFVPFEMLDKLYEAANVEKEKLIIEDAKHAEAVIIDPEKYWNTVWKFSDKYFK